MSEAAYDIIVAGAGMSGSLAAGVAAKLGKSVLLLDRNPPELVGKKTPWGWTCGDAVAGSHIDFVTKKTGLTFGSPELDLKVGGIYAISPDLKTRFQFDGVGYVLDRPEFERKLRDFAVRNGTHYVPEFEVEGPIIENNFVVGIFGKDREKKTRRYRAKIVIDALGMATVLRRRLNENPYLERFIDINDVESTGRYIYEFELDHEDPNYYDPKNALIHLNQEMAPGGYGWVFPKHGKTVNIGVGVQKKSLEIRNQKLNKNDTLQKLIDEYVRWNTVLKNPKLFNKDGNGKGIWSVAVRRQMESLVYNGYMGAGDSMLMPNPISAGGIGPALIAGVLAGEDAVKAIDNNDISVRGLWHYNLDFNREYGKKTAGMEAFRVYLQSLNNDVLNYGMRTFLTTNEATALTNGLIPELSLTSKFKMVLKGARNINAFKNLVYVVNKMKAFNALYEDYPKSPEGFEHWKSQVIKELEEVRIRFQPNPI